MKKKCVPCEGIGRAFTRSEAKIQLKDLKGWVLSKDAKSISRDFVLKNFVEAVKIINKIKDIAQGHNHHPDVHLTKYKNLQIVLYTHALGGVSQNDVIVAHDINQLMKKY